MGVIVLGVVVLEPSYEVHIVLYLQGCHAKYGLGPKVYHIPILPVLLVGTILRLAVTDLVKS